MNSAKGINRGDRLLVVAHDAGGASLLAAWLKKNVDTNQCEFLLQGPAERIFRETLGNVNSLSVNRIDSLDISAYSLVLTGTSSRHSSLEVSIIKRSKINRIYVVSMLDYWKNYQERFLYEEKKVLPDELWVCDEFAKKLVEKEFPDIPVYLKENAYLESECHCIAIKSKSFEKSEYLRILYVCEPSLHVNYSEFDVLRETLEYLDKRYSDKQNKIKFRLRLHPREEKGKYDEVLNEGSKKIEIELSVNSLLSDDIAWSQYVFGAQTAALVVALAANREVYSVAPSEVEKIALPHDGIRRVFPYKN